MASFHSHWVATGFAVLRKGGPRLTLFTTRPACQPAPPDTTHIRVASAYRPAGSGHEPTAGLALTVSNVHSDGRESHVAHVRAAAPAVATRRPCALVPRRGAHV